MEDEEQASLLSFCIFNFAFSRVLCVEKFFLSHTHLQTAILFIFFYLWSCVIADVLWQFYPGFELRVLHSLSCRQMKRQFACPDGKLVIFFIINLRAGANLGGGFSQ